MCGRIEAAIGGFSRALQLDPANAESRDNLLALREQCLKSIEVYKGMAGQPAGAGESASAASDATVERDAGVQLFFNAINQIPLTDPALSPALRVAIEASGCDSSYFVREAYRVLTTLAADVRRRVVERVLVSGEQSYRLRLVAALDAFEREDWPQVLQLVRGAGDRAPADLFIERVRMHAERKWHDSDPCHKDPFAGMEAYLKGSFCSMPWENLEIGSWGPEIEKTGYAYLCCPAQLPLIAGNFREQEPEGIWNSEAAQEIRRSMLDGSFRYCSRVQCPFIGGRKLNSREQALAQGRAATGKPSATLEELYGLQAETGPVELHVSYDRSCNLSCPSCRKEVYVAPKERQDQMEQAYSEKLRKLAKTAKIFYLDGAGEALASRHSRALIKSLTRTEYPRMKFHLISNGQLLDRRAWDDLDLGGRVEKIYLSMDGARPETYGITRRGGTLERFLKNLAFLDGLRRNEGERFELIIHYVVSALTFREMPEAVRLARQYHIDRLFFIALRNWGHMPKEEVRQWMVTNPEHALHEEFVQVLSDPELEDPLVEMGSVMESRRGKWSPGGGGES